MRVATSFPQVVDAVTRAALLAPPDPHPLPLSTRVSRTSGRKAERRSRAVADKESGRWLVGAEQAATVCAEAREITVIADRESDIYAAFAHRPANVHLLVRAAQDRCLEDGDRLFAAIDALPEDARTSLKLPPQPGRPARDVVLAIRFTQVQIARPRHGPRKGLPGTITVNVVDAREVDPPATGGVHWRLLTTHAVEDVEDARGEAAGVAAIEMCEYGSPCGEGASGIPAAKAPRSILRNMTVVIVFLDDGILVLRHGRAETGVPFAALLAAGTVGVVAEALAVVAALHAFLEIVGQRLRLGGVHRSLDLVWRLSRVHHARVSRDPLRISSETRLGHDI